MDKHGNYNDHTIISTFVNDLLHQIGNDLFKKKKGSCFIKQI